VLAEHKIIPVMLRLARICRLSIERHFSPDLIREDSAQRQRVSHKLQLCPEKYQPIVEAAIDGVIKLEE